jgi:RNA polymerase sigma-70 factor (ECF subfamily)
MPAARASYETSSLSYAASPPTEKELPVSKARALGIAPLTSLRGPVREESARGGSSHHGPGHEFRARLAELVPELQRWANRLTDQGTDAMDLVQETCRKALEAYAQFTCGDDLKPWLFRILRNLHVDHCRRAWRLVCVDNVEQLLPETESDAQPLWRSVSDDQMAQALARLPPLYRSAYLLRTVNGLSYGEMSQRLGISLNTVGTRLMRARERLRSSLLAQLPSV